MRRDTVSLMLMSFALVRPALAIAQSGPTPVSFDGSILDPTGAPIAGAEVAAISGDQITEAATVTDQRGAFKLLLPPGSYTLKVTADGFVEQIEQVTAPRAGGASREMVLKVAGVREAVTVSAIAGGYQVR